MSRLTLCDLEVPKLATGFASKSASKMEAPSERTANLGTFIGSASVDQMETVQSTVVTTNVHST